MGKDLDDLEPFPPHLRRKIQLMTEGPHTGHQKQIFEEIRRLTEPYERFQSQFLEQLGASQQSANAISEIIAASNASIALFRDSLVGKSWYLELEKMHKSWQIEFASVNAITEQVRATAAFDLSLVTRNLTVSESLSQALAAVKSFEMPGLTSDVLGRIRLEQNVLSGSLKSLLDSIVTPHDYLSLPFSSVVGASREVFTSTYAIGALVLSIQDDIPFELSDEEGDVREEVSDCVELIKSIDPDLVRLYYGSTEALEGTSVDKARHVLTSLRELFTQILHRLAPDDEVEGWVDLTDGKLWHNGRPTRKARVLYLCRQIGHGDLERFIRLDADAIVSLFDTYNDVHKVNPKLTDKQLSALVLRTESFVSYLIQLKRETL